MASCQGCGYQHGLVEGLCSDCEATGTERWYWIFVERETGRQVEWNDEFGEWLRANYGGDEGLGREVVVDMVRVAPTDDVRPTSINQHGDCREAYEPFPQPPEKTR